MGAFTPLHIIFYIFATLAIAAGVVVITAKNPVRSVLALVVCFFAMASIWMMLRAEFLSLILLLVYVGAVMTLFLFVVMMLNIDIAKSSTGFVRYWPFTVVVAVSLTGILMLAFTPAYAPFAQMPPPPAVPANYSNTEALGSLLYTTYAYPFEIAGVILLAAIIAAITLAQREPRKRKIQHPSTQVNVDPQKRLHIIKMPSAPRQDTSS